VSMDQVDAEVELLVRAGVVGENDQEKARRMLKARHTLFHRIEFGPPRDNFKAATVGVMKAIAELRDTQQRHESTLDELKALAKDPRCEEIYARLEKSVVDFSSACKSLTPPGGAPAEVIGLLEGEISASVRALQEVLKQPSSLGR
jgi:hypothetical protein